MKARSATTLIVAIASLLNATSAHAYTRGCSYGSVPPNVASNPGLNPTFMQWVHLYPTELAPAYETASTLWLRVLTTWSWACDVSISPQWEAVGGAQAGSTGDFWSYLNGLLPGCNGAEYRAEFTRAFRVTFDFYWTDPNDPFQVPQHYYYNGIWPSEPIPCPQGYVRGYLY